MTAVTKAVLFDLDGTLVDSVPGLWQAVNAILAQQDAPACGMDEVRQWVGNGPAKLVERALRSRDVNLPLEVGLEAFREHYSRTLYNAAFYPGVPAGLASLADAGFQLACITNKSSVFTGPFLEHLGLGDRFHAVLCGDEVEHPKPHPQSLAVVCDRFGIEPSQALMVGDSANDLAPALALGMPSVAVSYGYHQNQSLEDFAPLLVTDRFGEVVRFCRARR